MAKDNEISTPAQLPASTLTAGAARIAFHDKVFESRTLVFANGTTLVVEKSTIVASDEEQTAALARHPDFERAADGS